VEAVVAPVAVAVVEAERCEMPLVVVPMMNWFGVPPMMDDTMMAELAAVD